MIAPLASRSFVQIPASSPASPLKRTPATAVVSAPESHPVDFGQLTPAAKVTSVVALVLATLSLGALAFVTFALAPYLVLAAVAFLGIAITAVMLGQRADAKPAAPSTPDRARVTSAARLIATAEEPATAASRSLAPRPPHNRTVAADGRR